MSLYAVVMQSAKPSLVVALRRHVTDCFPVHDTLVVVRWSGSAKALFDTLDLPAEDRKGFVILQVSPDYYGFSSKTFWDWLATGFRDDSVG